jgi:hypothetical protein
LSKWVLGFMPYVFLCSEPLLYVLENQKVSAFELVFYLFALMGVVVLSVFVVFVEFMWEILCNFVAFLKLFLEVIFGQG